MYLNFLKFFSKNIIILDVKGKNFKRKRYIWHIEFTIPEERSKNVKDKNEKIKTKMTGQ